VTEFGTASPPLITWPIKDHVATLNATLKPCAPQYCTCLAGVRSGHASGLLCPLPRPPHLHERHQPINQSLSAAACKHTLIASTGTVAILRIEVLANVVLH